MTELPAGPVRLFQQAGTRPFLVVRGCDQEPRRESGAMSNLGCSQPLNQSAIQVDQPANR